MRAPLGIVASSLNRAPSVGGPTEVHTTHTFSSDGDENDWLSWIGTQDGTDTYVNCARRGVMFTGTVPFSGGWPYSGCADHADTTYISVEAGGASAHSLIIDLGPNRKASVSEYGLKNRHDFNEHPTGWDLEGSNDPIGDGWTTIDSRSGAGGSWSGLNQIAHFVCNGDSISEFRYFRHHQTANSSNGNQYQIVGEWSPYGTMTTLVAAVASGGEVDLTDVTGDGMFANMITDTGAPNLQETGRVEMRCSQALGGGWMPWNMFGGPEAWLVTAAQLPGYAMWVLGQTHTFRPTKMRMHGRTGYNTISEWTLEGSNDGDAWTEIQHVLTHVLPYIGNGENLFDIDANAGAYRFFKLTVLGYVNGFETNPGFGDGFDLYGYDERTVPSEDRPAGVDLNTYTDLCDLLAPTPFVHTVAAGSAANLINQNEVADEVYTTDVVDSDMGVDFGTDSVIPRQIALRNRNGGDHSPGHFFVEGSNDGGSTWDVLREVDTMTYYWLAAMWGVWWIDGAATYHQVRVRQHGLNNSGNNILLLGELQLFGDQAT